MKKIFAAVAVVAGLALVTGCSSYDVEQDKTAIEIDGYLLNKTDKKKVTCHDAGKSGYGGSGNSYVYLPAGQRTYSFTGSSSELEMGAIPVSFDDDQTVKQPGLLKFTLTTDCDALYDFWTKVGIKNEVDTKEGWAKFLNDYFGVPVTTALNDITGPVANWRLWYGDSALRTKAQTDLVPVLQKAINESVGSDEWFKVSSVSLSKPIPSEELLSGLEKIETIKLENDAITQKNTGLLTKYDAIAACVSGDRGNGKSVNPLPVDTCELMYAIDSGSVSVIPVPQGTGLNLNAN